ncbi:MAG: type II toxin-antitoxin system VapC family toxin [Dehalococcoidia bacterium]
MGLIVLDAGVLIAFLDAADTHHAPAREALAAASAAGDSLALAASAYAEVLVGPSRRGDAEVEQLRAFVGRFPVRVVPLNEAIAEAAAVLRARHGSRLRLPDALVIATAVVLDADVILTTDRRWPSRSALGLPARIVHV